MNPFEKKLSFKETSKVRNANSDTKKKYTLPVLKMKTDEGYKPDYKIKADTKKDSNFTKGLLGFINGTLLGQGEANLMSQTGMNTTDITDNATGGSADYLGKLIAEKIYGDDRYQKLVDSNKTAIKSAGQEFKSKTKQLANEEGLITPYKVGNVLGNMADFAAGYGAFGSTVEGSKLIKPLATKGLAGKYATELAKDIAIGTPMNAVKAMGNDLKGDDFRNDMILNFGIDVLTNVVLAGGGAILKGMKKSDIVDEAVKVMSEKPEVAKMVLESTPNKIASPETSSTLESISQPLPVMKSVEPTITKPVIETKFKQGDTVELSSGDKIKVKRIENDNYIVDVNGQEGHYPINSVDSLDDVKKIVEPNIESEAVIKFDKSTIKDVSNEIAQADEVIKGMDTKKGLPMDIQLFAKRVDDLRATLKRLQGKDIGKITKTEYDRIKALRNEIAKSTEYVMKNHTVKSEVVVGGVATTQKNTVKRIHKQVKAPKYVKDQVIEVGGKKYKVDTINKDTYKVVDYETGTKRNISIDELEKGEVSVHPNRKKGFTERDIETVSKSPAISKEYPELHSDIKTMAKELQYDIEHTIKGERITQVDPQGNVFGTLGMKRLTSDTMAYLLDDMKLPYKQIKDSLERIVNGKSLYAIDKKIELAIDDALTNGYKNFEGELIEPNLNYIAKKGEIKSYTTPTSKEIQLKQKIEQIKSNIRFKSLTTKENDAFTKFATKSLDELKKMKSGMKKYTESGYRMAEDLLNQFDVTSKNMNESKVLETRKIVQDAQDLYGADFKEHLNESVLKKLDRLDKKKIGDMTIDELKDVQDAVGHIRNMEQIKSNEFKINSKQTLKDAVVESLDHMPDAKDNKNVIKFLKGAELYLQSPRTFFKKLSNYSNNGLDKHVFGAIETGNEVRAGIKRKLTQALEPFKDVERNLVDNSPTLETIKLVDKELKMSQDTMLDLYAVSMDKGQVEGLIEGGYRVYGEHTNFKFTEADIKVFQDNFRTKYPELVKYYENNSKLFAESGEIINETYTKLNGYPLIREKNTTYYPATRLGMGQSIGDMPKNIPPSMENYSFTKDRVKNNKAIQGKSYIRTIYNHIEHTSNYGGLAEPIRNARLIVNDQNVKDSLNIMNDVKVSKSMGSKLIFGVTEHLDKYLNDVARNLPNSKESLLDEVYHGWLSNAQAAAMGANPSVMLKQPASYPTAMSVIDAKYLFNPMVMKKVSKEKLKTIFEYAPTLWERFTQGHSTIEVGDVKTAKGFISRKGFVNKVKNIDWGKGITLLDETTTLRLWNAAELQVKAQGFKEGTDEFYKATARLTQDAMSQTQSIYDNTFRTGLQRSKNPVVKLATLFTSQSQQNYNLISQAIDEIKLGKTEDGLKKISGVIAGTLTIAATQVGIDTLKGKGDEASFADSFIENSIGNVMFADKLYKVIMSKVNHESFKESFLPNILDDTIGNALNDIWALGDKMDPKQGYNTYLGRTVKALSSLAVFVGLPIRNMRTWSEVALKGALPDEAYREYQKLWRHSGNGELYEEYFKGIENGKTDVLPVLKDLNYNEAKKTGLQSSLTTKYKKLYIKDGLSEDEALSKAKQSVKTLPYLNTLKQ